MASRRLNRQRLAPLSALQRFPHGGGASNSSFLSRSPWMTDCGRHISWFCGTADAVAARALVLI
jgi:hypothetical protein